jgi:hypothetical protein
MRDVLPSLHNKSAFIVFHTSHRVIDGAPRKQSLFPANGISFW